jgi:hypothetical protein
MALPSGRPEFNQINVAFIHPIYPIAKSSFDDPIKRGAARKRDRQPIGIGPVVVDGLSVELLVLVEYGVPAIGVTDNTSSLAAIRAAATECGRRPRHGQTRFSRGRLFARVIKYW